MTPNRRLKQARELRGWSQAKVAEQIGTDATTVSRWERGLFSPTPYFRERLCTLFHLNAEELGLLETGEPPLEKEQRVLSPHVPGSLLWQQEHGDATGTGTQTDTIAPPEAPSWPRRGDTFGYILDSAAHDQQAHSLWEDAYVRAMRGQRTEAQQLGEASLSAFEHVGHPNAEAIREWLKKNELLPPPSPPSGNVPSAPLPLLTRTPKKTIKQIFRRRNLGLALLFLTIGALCFASVLVNQSSAPRVQAGIQTLPTARTHKPAQALLQTTATGISSTPTTAVATPSPVPTRQATAPASIPTAAEPVLSITITPANLTPANCSLESLGYRCTLTVLLFSGDESNLSWKVRSTSLPVQFNPPSGMNRSGQPFEDIAYIQSSPGQACQLIFTVTTPSAYSRTVEVPWQG